MPSPTTNDAKTAELDASIPAAVINRLAKAAMGGEGGVAGEAKAVLNIVGRIFVHYYTAAILDVARAHGRTRLLVGDAYEALHRLDMAELVEPTKVDIEALVAKNSAKSKKRKEESSAKDGKDDKDADASAPADKKQKTTDDAGDDDTAAAAEPAKATAA